MAVIEGEGRVPILFGSLALPVPPNRPAYIARPDLRGEFATVVIAHDDRITSSVKAMARRLARHGYGVFVPALRPDLAAAARDLADAVHSARIPGTPWASAERTAVVGLGSGGVVAAIVAADEEVGPLVLIAASLDSELLARHSGRLLVLHGADDAVTPDDELRQIRQEVGRGEWVVYNGVGARFYEDSNERYDAAAADDVMGRLVDFLDARFGAVPSSV